MLNRHFIIFQAQRNDYYRTACDHTKAINTTT